MAINDKLTALQVMQDSPVIPVIVLHDVAHAVPMARALLKARAGDTVTLHTPAGLESIEVQDVRYEPLATGEAPSVDLSRASG